MSKKNLGILLSILGGSIGFIGLISGGFFAMIALLLVYYVGIGFVMTELTEMSDNMGTWLFDLLDIKLFK